MIRVNKQRELVGRNYGYVISYRQAGLLMSVFGFKLPKIGREVILANVEGYLSGSRIGDFRQFPTRYEIVMKNIGNGKYMLVDECDYLRSNAYIKFVT